MQAKRFIFADSETNPFKRGVDYKVYVFGAYTKWFDKRKKKFTEHATFDTYENIRDFIDFCTKDNEPTICYFHNGGKFDYFFFLDYINGPATFIAGRLASFKIGSCEFRDSLCIIPIALRKYKKDDFDYSLLNDYIANKETIISYLRSDCIYLSEMVCYFIENYGQKLTLASNAMHIWKKMAGVKNDEIRTTSEVYDSIYRKFYFGGRVEAAKIGEIYGDIKCFDINSSYPFAMLHAHPFGYYVRVSESEKTIEGYSFIQLKCESLGQFCLKMEVNGIAETSFPNDGIVREFFTTGWEYLAAKKLGLLKCVEIVEVRTHRKTKDFSDYVNRFYDMKRNSDSGTLAYITAKLFMNSLYGKFGQDWRNYDESYISDKTLLKLEVESGYNDDKKIKILAFVRRLSKNRSLYTGKCEEGEWYNVATSASITGFARAKLLEAIHDSYGFLYCDTDSIVCEKFKGKCSCELGDWKEEGKFKRALIIGKKLYYLAYQEKGENEHDKFACKGVRIGLKEFEKMCKGEGVTYLRDTPSMQFKQGRIHYLSRTIGLRARIAKEENKGKNLEAEYGKFI